MYIKCYIYLLFKHKKMTNGRQQLTELANYHKCQKRRTKVKLEGREGSGIPPIGMASRGFVWETQSHTNLSSKFTQIYKQTQGSFYGTFCAHTQTLIAFPSLAFLPYDLTKQPQGFLDRILLKKIIVFFITSININTLLIRVYKNVVLTHYS